MYRVTLTADQRQELHRRTRLKGRAPATRDRLEMVRLSDAGWSVPKIAHHPGLHHQTVRAWIKACLTTGFDALPNTPRGGKTSRLTPAMLESIRADLAKAERTWSSPHLADWLAEHHGHRISPGRLRVHLKRANLSSQRTSCSLKHKQAPEQLAERKAALEALANKGRLD